MDMELSDTTFAMHPFIFLLGMLCAYLAGSINFSILLLRILGREDPRNQYSGNPGMTNVFRQHGLPLAVVVLVLDVSRAIAVALTAIYFWIDAWVPWAGFGLILGNRLPCFHGFKGGKGVANYLGFCVIPLPLGTGMSVTAYLFTIVIVRIPFVASFAMLAILTVSGIFRWGHTLVGLSAVLMIAVSIVWFHRSNISKLLDRN
jgi:glycerol-3-phosphate acyltransferase PlsY